jgi:hypothetical protein
MHVDHSPLRRGQNLRPQDVTIGHHDSQVAVEAAQGLSKDISHRFHRLEDRDIQVLGDHLGGGGEELGTGTSLRLVGLGDDGGDIESGGEERLEGRHRELRGAEEHDSHYGEPAAVEPTSLM